MKRFEKAFNELKEMGAPVFHLGQGWSGEALFTVSGEMNYGEIWADYYDEFDIGNFGVNEKVLKVLNKYGLFAEWYNAGVLEVYKKDW